MDGIVNIVKELLGSKLTCAGVCFTAAVMHFGPKYAEIPALPADWRWVPFVTMLLTGFFCTWWVASGAFLVLDSLFLARRLRSNELKPADLTANERKLFGYLARLNGAPASPMSSMEFRFMFPDRFARNIAAQDLAGRGLLAAGHGDLFLSTAGQRFYVKYQDEFRQP